MRALPPCPVCVGLNCRIAKEQTKSNQRVSFNKDAVSACNSSCHLSRRKFAEIITFNSKFVLKISCDIVLNLSAWVFVVRHCEKHLSSI